MPRPTKLTPAVQARFMQAITLGATRRHACAYAGIAEETLYAWLRRGARGRPEYRQFSESLKEAEGRAVVGWLAKIEQAASDGTWQAAAWKLERLYPQEYGRTVQEHTGTGGGAVVVRVVYEAETPEGPEHAEH